MTDLWVSTERPYQVRLYQEGALYGELPGIVQGGNQATFRMDGGNSMSLRLDPGSIPTGVLAVMRDPKATIVLCDRSGLWKGVFRIGKFTTMRKGEEKLYAVECEDALIELQRAFVESYAATSASITDIVTDLLAEQSMDYTLGLGVIDEAIGAQTRTVEFEQKSVLECLKELQTTLLRQDAGLLYVDPANNLNWKRWTSNNGETLEVGQHIVGLEREEDYGELYTRVYAYGEGNEPDNRLALTDAGEAHDYIDSANTATYGVMPRRIDDRRIRDGASLLVRAQAALSHFEEPRYTYKLSLIELAHADADDSRTWGQFAPVQPGGKYTVTDSDLGISTEVQAAVVELDLDNPLGVRIELANHRRDMADLLKELYDRTDQPLHVGGDRYPMMGRNCTTGDPDSLRAGDTRWNDGQDRGEMHDGDEWRNLMARLQLSDETPQPSPWGEDAGDGTKAARDDHVHGMELYNTWEGLNVIAEKNNGALAYITNEKTVCVADEDEDTWYRMSRYGGTVEQLPAIPTYGELTVFWTSDGSGSGDDQKWTVHAGQSEWTPTQKTTTLSGEPPS